MIELESDFWNTEADYRCITTNGALRANGRAIMGAGIALAARSRYPELEVVLGNLIHRSGNHVYPLGHSLISFPTKHHWKQSSSLSLIVQSAHELVALMDTLPDARRVVMTRPGCGMGRLQWRDVGPVLASILDDRFIIASI